MLSGDARAVARLAASVADGTPIDWGHAEAEVAPAERRLIRHLRLVENIATLYRTLPPEPSEDLESTFREPSGPRWGPLVLLEQIGQGASSEVHRAWDTALHRHVAVKLLKRDELGVGDPDVRMLEEARRLARLRHENVVHVYGAEQHDGRVGLWMELVRGESLEQIVKSRGPFGAREAAGIGQDLCAALAAVHGAGLLHRDLKAQNVIRESGGRVVLMDFGTGEELRQDVGTNRLIGTPLYLAPEVFRGEPASVQSDLYSLGVLLFYLVTGEFPIVAGSMAHLAQVHAHGQRRRLRDVRSDVPKKAFVHVVEHALEADPSGRYRSAGEMASALRDSLEEPLTELAETSGRARWFHPPAFGAIAAAILLVIIITALGLWSRGGAPARVPTISRLAVLPLVDVSGAPSEGVTDAITTDLISTLGQIRALQITPRTSVLGFKDSQDRLVEIAAALGVDVLVQGTVLMDARRSDSEQVSVNLRLIVAGTDQPFWAQTFVRSRGQMRVMQADIARAIAGAVNAPIAAAEADQLGGARPTSQAAEEAYVQGRIHLAGYGLEPARQAIAAFQRAIQFDANHAPAYSGLARAYITLALHHGMPHPEARGSAIQAARRSRDLDEGLADAHAILAEIYFLYDWDWDGAEREYLRCLDLNPSFAYARAYYAQFLAATRRFDEALDQALKARAQDPESSDAQLLPAIVSYYRGDYQAAEQVLNAMPATVLNPNIMLGRVMEAQGRIDDAMAFTNRAAAQGALGVPLRVQLTRLQALAGRQEDARASLRELQRDAASRRVRLSARDLGYIHLSMGDEAAALDAFEEAVAERDPSLVWIGVDPRLDPLRANPRFQAILQRMKLP